MDNSELEHLKPEDILKEIVHWVNNDVTYFDALVHYADKYDIEIELIGEIVRSSPQLKDRVRRDAEKRLMVEKTTRLPI